ncbi:hypothetical protein SADUNF_Sadunf11G0121800 [Salix dunnii]|uniref:Uncharacterized protein n=1 Tax=Salix dunnii TaxID=1413687 RepID=A0A835JPH1_9ROSI|nr:hypothetical protein SADUNF_Sadunf11G0121800 [Salix dunnii]
MDDLQLSADSINSVSSLTKTLSMELADVQRQLLAIATNSGATNPLATQPSNGPLASFHEKVDLQGIMSLHPLPLGQGGRIALSATAAGL